jgi:GT2 family glycosyltransferase
MFQDPTGGWPSWDDVDFGYRAHLQGFRLWRSHRAVAHHHDCSLESLESSCERQTQASRSAARLFERHPELAQHISAFRDKGSMSFLVDSPDLLGRKALRSLASQPLSVSAMGRLTCVLEKHMPGSSLLALLYRWIISAHMYKGYRQGLRELEASRHSLD